MRSLQPLSLGSLISTPTEDFIVPTRAHTLAPSLSLSLPNPKHCWYCFSAKNTETGAIGTGIAKSLVLVYFYIQREREPSPIGFLAYKREMVGLAAACG